MKVTVHLTVGSVTIDTMPDDDALAVLDDFENGADPTLRFALDDNAVTVVARRHVVRIDVDEE